MSRYESLLHQMRDYRRHFVDRLDFDMSPENVQRLAMTHLAILAIQAVEDGEEVLPVVSGPVIEFGDDGWPVLASR